MTSIVVLAFIVGASLLFVAVFYAGYSFASSKHEVEFDTMLHNISVDESLHAIDREIILRSIERHAPLSLDVGYVAY